MKRHQSLRIGIARQYRPFQLSAICWYCQCPTYEIWHFRTDSCPGAFDSGTGRTGATALWTTSSSASQKLVAPKSSDNPVQCFAKHPGSTAGSLSLHYGCCDVPWFKVATRVKEQLEELGDLEGQVARAREDAKNILEEVEEIAEAVENEAENLQQEMGRERETLSGLVSLLNQKSKLLQNYRQNSKLHQNLEQLS